MRLRVVPMYIGLLIVVVSRPASPAGPSPRTAGVPAATSASVAASDAEPAPELAWTWRKGLTPSGPPTGHLGTPQSIAIDSAGGVYISDGTLHHFSPSGALIREAVSYGNPYLLSVAPDSTILVSQASQTGNHVDFLRFRDDVLAGFINSHDCEDYCCTNCGMRSFENTWTMTIGRTGLVYTFSFCNQPYPYPPPPDCGSYGKLTVMSPGGDVQWIWLDSKIQQERAVYPFAMQEGPPGILNVGARWRDVCATEVHIMHFTTNWDYLGDFQVPEFGCNSIDAHDYLGAAFDQHGNAYVPVVASKQVVKYNRQGQLLSRWPLPIHLPPSVVDPYGFTHNTISRIAVGRDSLIYVAVGNDARPESTAVYVFSYDADGDSLLDAWEKYGVDGNDDGVVDYELPDADPLHKDVYVEVDAMTGLAPDPRAIQGVVDAFAAVPRTLLPSPNPDSLDGITLHVEVDETGLPVAPWSDPPWGEFAQFKRDHFGTPVERLSVDVIAAKRRVVRYGPFVQQFGGRDWSGCAYDVPSFDFFVSLGHSLWGTVSWQEQAGTFMHELGHTLGLCHGGGQCEERRNYKPNYHSVMNYDWQLPLRQVWTGVAAKALATLHSSWRLDYSRAEQPAIVEDAADEGVPIAATDPGWTVVGPPCVSTPNLAMLTRTEGWVDWDRDSAIDPTPTCTDANYITLSAGASPGDTLTGHVDWSNLDFEPTVPPVWSEAGARSKARVSPVEMTYAVLDSLSRMRFDCNGNGVPDDAEIEAGTLADANHNGVPDGCERTSTLAVPPPSLPGPGLRMWGTPNPAVGGTDIGFSLPRPGFVRLAIFDAGGRRIRALRDGFFMAGMHHVGWDGRDGRDARAVSGVYFARLEFEERSWTLRISLMK
jgi:hypothetical protein